MTATVFHTTAAAPALREEKLAAGRLEYNQPVLAELDQHFLDRSKGCSREVRKLRAGIDGVIRENLTDGAVASVLNDQLMPISREEVAGIINAFPEEHREAARIVLAVISQHAQYESLSDFVEKCREAAAAAFSQPNSVVLLPRTASLTDALHYFANKKCCLGGDSMFRNSSDLTVTQEIFIDDSCMQQIRADQALAEAIAKGDKIALLPLVCHGAITPFNAPLPSQIAEKVRAVLQDCLVCAGLWAETAGEGRWEAEQLPELINQVLTMNAETGLAHALAVHGLTPNTARVVRVPLTCPTQVDDDAIAERLNGSLVFTAEQVADALAVLPEVYRPLARELVVQEAYMESARSIAVAAHDLARRITQFAAGRGISPADIYLYAAGDAKSPTVAGQALRQQLGLPLNQVVPAGDTKRLSTLSPKSVVVVADDVSGSGSSLGGMGAQVIDSGYRGEVVMAAVLGSRKCIRLDRTFGQKVRKEPRLHYVPHLQVTPLHDTRLYRSAGPDLQVMLDRICGDKGFCESSLQICLPYMIPDNTCAFFGRRFGKVMAPAGANKVRTYSQPGDEETKEHICAAALDVRTVGAELKEADSSMQLAEVARHLERADLVRQLTATNSENYSEQRRSAEEARPAFVAALSSGLSGALDHLEVNLRHLPPSLDGLRDLTAELRIIKKVAREFRDTQPAEFARLRRLRGFLRQRTGQALTAASQALFDPEISSTVMTEGRYYEWKNKAERLIETAAGIDPRLAGEARRCLRKAFKRLSLEYRQFFERQFNALIKDHYSQTPDTLLPLKDSVERIQAHVLAMSELELKLGVRAAAQISNSPLAQRLAASTRYLQIKQDLLRADSKNPQGFRAARFQWISKRLPEMGAAARVISPGLAEDIDRTITNAVALASETVDLLSAKLNSESREFKDLKKLEEERKLIWMSAEDLAAGAPVHAETFLVAAFRFEAVFNSRYSELLVREAEAYQARLLRADPADQDFEPILAELNGRLGTYRRHLATRNVAVEMLQSLEQRMPAWFAGCMFRLSEHNSGGDVERLYCGVRSLSQEVIESAQDLLSEPESRIFENMVGCARNAFLVSWRHKADAAPAMPVEQFGDMTRWAWSDYREQLKRYPSFDRMQKELRSDSFPEALRRPLLKELKRRLDKISARLGLALNDLEHKLVQKGAVSFGGMDEPTRDVLPLLNDRDLCHFWMAGKARRGADKLRTRVLRACEQEGLASARKSIAALAESEKLDFNAGLAKQVDAVWEAATAFGLESRWREELQSPLLKLRQSIERRLITGLDEIMQQAADNAGSQSPEFFSRLDNDASAGKRGSSAPIDLLSPDLKNRVCLTWPELADRAESLLNFEIAARGCRWLPKEQPPPSHAETLKHFIRYFNSRSELERHTVNPKRRLEAVRALVNASQALVDLGGSARTAVRLPEFTARQQESLRQAEPLVSLIQKEVEGILEEFQKDGLLPLYDTTEVALSMLARGEWFGREQARGAIEGLRARLAAARLPKPQHGITHSYIPKGLLVPPFDPFKSDFFGEELHPWAAKPIGLDYDLKIKSSPHSLKPAQLEFTKLAEPVTESVSLPKLASELLEAAAELKKGEGEE
jgi:hypothetical protein